MKKVLFLMTVAIILIGCTKEPIINEINNEKIMALTIPAFTEKVRIAISENTNNIGELCTSDKINRWSRWKPIRLNTKSPITDADIAFVKSGLVVPSVKGYSNVIDFYNSNQNFKFEYLKPRGGGFNEPCRIGDFRNYDHSAEIFYDVAVPNFIFTGLLNVRLYTYLPAFGGSDLESWINWHFLGLDDLYFGIIVRKKYSSSYDVYYSDTPVSVGGELIDNILLQHYLSPVPSVETDYEVFSFLSELPDEDPSSLDFYILEEGYHEFSFLEQLKVTGSAEVMSGGVEYVIDIDNQTTSSILMQGISLLIRYADNDIDREIDELEPFETEINVGNRTIEPTPNLILTDQVIGLLPNFSSRGGYVYFMSTSHPHLNKKIIIIQS